VKFLAAEIQKCNMGTETTAMSGNLTCATDMGSAATIAEKAELALADFKNPFTPSSAGVTDAAELGVNGFLKSARASSAFSAIVAAEPMSVAQVKLPLIAVVSVPMLHFCISAAKNFTTEAWFHLAALIFALFV
jgi:hypothetical protein